MPLSVFRGRPLSERTTHIYDTAGRLVASETVREAPWLPSDRWLALALHDLEVGQCPGCGQPKHRAWHPSMRGWYDWDEKDCAACQARDASKSSSPGTYLIPIDMRPPDKPLGPWPEYSESL